MKIILVMGLLIFVFAACGNGNGEAQVIEVVEPVEIEEPPTPENPEIIEPEEIAEPEEIEEFYEPSPVALFETSFETGYDGVEGRGAIIERASIYVRTSDFALMVAMRSEDYHGLVLNVTQYVQDDGEYEFSLWAFNPSHIPINFQLVAGDSIDGNFSAMYGENSSATIVPGEWGELRGVLQGQNFVALETRGGAMAVFYVDDLVVVRLP